MSKSFFALLGFALCAGSVQGQQTSLAELLDSVEANNKSLAAYRGYLEGESWRYKSENKLPDPQASAYYLPFGEHNGGDYTEFEISQRLEFPSVYAARNKWIDEQKERLEREYEKLRQDILLSAKKLGIEWVYLQKQEALHKQRIIQSKKVYDQVTTLFDKGQIGILDQNKAKIVWLDQQFALEELDIRKENVKQKLQALNGGNEISFGLSTYPEVFDIPPQDSLWMEWQRRDAQMALLEQEIQAARQGLKVKRNQLLPDITAGYNYQGVAGSNYSGFYGGISIPLWSGRSKLKMAAAQINFQEHHKSKVLTALKSEFTSQVQQYQFLLKKFREYQSAMEGLNSEMLLQKSYALGEISFMDYYREVAFYREAENRMLEIEKELQQLRAEIFKYQL